MGFFSDIFSKKACELCGKEAGVLGRAKLKDGKFICTDCVKDCSAFYPTTIHTLEEVKEHMEYMKKFDSFCSEVFDANDNKESFTKLFQSTGIVLCDELGMFEIITRKTKEKNYRELFRYDQIFDYKLYGKENTAENPPKKYTETGIMIKMISEKTLDPLYLANHQYDQYKNEYATEFTIPCSGPSDVLDGGFLLKHLDRVFNEVITGKLGVFGQGTVDRTNYHRLDEVDMKFERAKWKEIADEAETKFFGKTLK